MPDSSPPTDLPHEEFVERHTMFDGKLLHVIVDDVRLPSGTMAVREFIDHPGAAFIIPVTRDGQVLMVRQYRYTVDEVLLELPAGVIDPGEDPAETAARELIEETGYRAGTLRHLATTFVSPGYSREAAHLYLATDCQPTEHDPDEDEPLELMHLTIEDVQRTLINGRLPNAQTMMGVLWLLRLIECGELTLSDQ